jgi:hypothetical protein
MEHQRLWGMALQRHEFLIWALGEHLFSYLRMSPLIREKELPV